MSEVEVVDYKTFANHLLNSEISNIKIYKFTGDIEVTYDHNGISYASSGPYGPSEDHLLHSILDTKNIEYTILENEYEGESSTMNYIGPYGGFLFMALPIILAIVILIQAKTIKNLSSKIQAK